MVGADLIEVVQVGSKRAASTDDGAHDAQRRPDLGEHQDLTQPAEEAGRNQQDFPNQHNKVQVLDTSHVTLGLHKYLWHGILVGARAEVPLLGVW